MARRLLELSRAWGCHPLRDLDTGDRLDAAELPVPQSLVSRLDKWAARWDLAYDVARPDVPKVDTWVLEELARDGAHLWKAVLTVLPPTSYDVVYVHEGTLYRDPRDLPPAWW